ncbi:MAG: MarR family winged helix-turn-helix transcriptional regulator [Paracoccaceae bacterium]
MTTLPPPSPATVAVWTRLMRASAHLLALIEADLKAAGLPPLAWYDALWEIEKAGPNGIRPFTLQERLLLPQYGLSRLIDRMARDRLVARGRAQGDGRGQVLTLTPEGRAMRARVWPVYGAALDRAVAARMPPGEAEALAALLARLYPPRGS